MARIVLLALMVVISASSVAHAQLAVDHLFVIVSEAAPEAQLLEGAGFSKPPEVTKHEGQGTASIFFDFDNLYLELVWIDDAEQLESSDPELAARFQGAPSTASPFGIGLHRTSPDVEELSFPTHSHTAEWMRPGTEIRIATGQPLVEPMVFVVPAYMSFPEFLKVRGDAPKHPNGAVRVTSVRLSGSGLRTRSPALDAVVRGTIIESVEADAPLLELELDHGRSGETLDCRPELPLVVRY